MALRATEEKSGGGRELEPGRRDAAEAAGAMDAPLVVATGAVMTEDTTALHVLLSSATKPPSKTLLI